MSTRLLKHQEHFGGSLQNIQWQFSAIPLFLSQSLCHSTQFTGETDSKTVEINVLFQIKFVNYFTVYDLKGFELAFKEKIGEEYLLLLLLLLILKWQYIIDNGSIFQTAVVYFRHRQDISDIGSISQTKNTGRIFQTLQSLIFSIFL